MSTLFELKSEFERLYLLASSDDENDAEVFNDTLEGMIGELEIKSEGYVQVIQRLDMEAKKADELADMMKHKADIRKNSIKRMKEMMLMAMNAAQVKKIDAGPYTIAVSKNGGKQPMVINGEVPDNFKRIIYEDDKELIRKHLESGETLSFARLLPRGEHISIK